jgi:hypothetical protein
MNTAKSLWLAIICTLIIVVIACSNNNNKVDVAQTISPTPTAISITPGGVYAEVITTDYTVGTNRLTIGLVDEASKILIEDADVTINIFYIDPKNGIYVEKGSYTPERLRVERGYSHTHADGVVESHGAGDIVVNIAHVEFDAEGNWVAEIKANRDGQSIANMSAVLDVHSEGQAHSIPIGWPSPLSVQKISSDVEDLFEIDTSSIPDPHMHNITIADAVTSGKPSIIIFGTPGFCVSLTCGPTKEIVDGLYEQQRDEAHFIHIEPYDLGKARGGDGLRAIPLMEEWGLYTEPWIFMVDHKGNVFAKFEGLVGPKELQKAFEDLMAFSSN